MEFVQKNTAKAMGEHGIECENKTFLDLDYADYLRVLHENTNKMNDFLDVFKVKGTRKG